MAKSKSDLLSATRTQLIVDDEPDTTAAAPAAPAAKPAPARTSTRTTSAKKPATKPRTTSAKKPASKPAAATASTSDNSLYDRLTATGDPMRVIYDTGLATRGAAQRVLNVQQPLPLRDALDRWAAAGEGRSRKALINALLAAYLADTGDLEVAES